MNRSQWIALSIALSNLALVLLFPPIDYLSIQRGNIPTFGGFHFVFNTQANQVINQNFLSLEILVVLINAAIAGLLLQGKPKQKRKPGISPAQRNILALVAVNLVLMLLFPPFENYLSLSKAVMPTFEGFYFVFGDNSQRQIVAILLYLEMALALVNGGLFWLFFSPKQDDPLSPQQIQALARKLRENQNKG